MGEAKIFWWVPRSSLFIYPTGHWSINIFSIDGCYRHVRAQRRMAQHSARQNIQNISVQGQEAWDMRPFLMSVGQGTQYTLFLLDFWFCDSLQQNTLLFSALQFSDNRNPCSSALCYQKDVTKISPCKLWKSQRNRAKLHFPIKQKLQNR